MEKLNGKSLLSYLLCIGMVLPYTVYASPLDKEKGKQRRSQEQQTSHFTPESESQEAGLEMDWGDDFPDVENNLTEEEKAAIEQQAQQEVNVLLEDSNSDEAVSELEAMGDMNQEEVDKEVLEKARSNAWYMKSMNLWFKRKMQMTLINKRRMNEYLTEKGLKNGFDADYISIPIDFGMAYLAMMGTKNVLQGKYGINKIQMYRKLNVARETAGNIKEAIDKDSKENKKYKKKLREQAISIYKTAKKEGSPVRVTKDHYITFADTSSKADEKLRKIIIKHNQGVRYARGVDKVIKDNLKRYYLNKSYVQYSERIKKSFGKRILRGMGRFAVASVRVLAKYGGGIGLGVVTYALFMEGVNKIQLRVAPEMMTKLDEWIESYSLEITKLEIELRTLEREELILSTEGVKFYE